jgi:hypothetical protein
MKPAKVPTWATSGAITEPSEAQKDSGFVRGQRAAVEIFNWLFNLAGAWCDYLSTLNASDIPIVDSAGKYTATNVEDALAEARTRIDGLQRLPAGTRMYFLQPSPPPGWVIVSSPAPATIQNAVIVVTGSSGGSFVDGEAFDSHTHALTLQVSPDYSNIAGKIGYHGNVAGLSTIRSEKQLAANPSSLYLDLQSLPYDTTAYPPSGSYWGTKDVNLTLSRSTAFIGFGGGDSPLIKLVYCILCERSS